MYISWPLSWFPFFSKEFPFSNLKLFNQDIYPHNSPNLNIKPRPYSHKTVILKITITFLAPAISHCSLFSCFSNYSIPLIFLVATNIFLISPQIKREFPSIMGNFYGGHRYFHDFLLNKRREFPSNKKGSPPNTMGTFYPQIKRGVPPIQWESFYWWPPIFPWCSSNKKKDIISPLIPWSSLK